LAPGVEVLDGCSKRESLDNDSDATARFQRPWHSLIWNDQDV